MNGTIAIEEKHLISFHSCAILGKCNVEKEPLQLSSSDLNQAYVEQDYAPVWVFSTIQTARLHLNIRQIGFVGQFYTFEFGDGRFRTSTTLIATFRTHDVASDVRSFQSSAWLSVSFGHYTPREQVPEIEIKGIYIISMLPIYDHL